MSKHEGLAVLDAALTYIKFHPEEWNQATWHCGSTACVAGHIATTIAGGRWLRSSNDTYSVEFNSELDGYQDAEYYITYGVSVDDRARKLLGEAYVPGMFEAENTWEDLLNYREQAKQQVKDAKRVKKARAEVDSWF